MLERYNAAIGFMMLALGSVATSRAASAQNASNDNFGAFAAMNGAAGRSDKDIPAEAKLRPTSAYWRPATTTE